MQKRIKKYIDGLVMVDLSSPQNSQIGRILYHIYYHNETLCDMAPARTGFPNNGGEHTFSVAGTPGDVAAWIELVIEKYSKLTTIPDALEELRNIVKQLKCKEKTQ